MSWRDKTWTPEEYAQLVDAGKMPEPLPCAHCDVQPRIELHDSGHFWSTWVVLCPDCDMSAAYPPHGLRGDDRTAYENHLTGAIETWNLWQQLAKEMTHGR